MAACESAQDPGEPPDKIEELGSFEFPTAARRSGAPALTPEERRIIAEAERASLASCMAEQGFELHLPELPPTLPWYLAPQTLRAAGYGVSASQMRVLYGGIPGDATGGLTGDEREAWEAAYFGTGDEPPVVVRGHDGQSSAEWSTGGCVGEVRAELYGSVANFVRFDRADPIMSTNEVVLELRSSADYVDAMQRWQDCVNSDGVLATLGAPGADGVEAAGNDDYGLNTLARIWTLLGEPMDSDLLDVATVDAGCQESSGLDALRSTRIDAARSAMLVDAGFDPETYFAFGRWLLDRAISMGD